MQSEPLKLIVSKMADAVSKLTRATGEEELLKLRRKKQQ